MIPVPSEDIFRVVLIGDAAAVLAADGLTYGAALGDSELAPSGTWISRVSVTPGCPLLAPAVNGCDAVAPLGVPGPRSICAIYNSCCFNVLHVATMLAQF